MQQALAEPRRRAYLQALGLDLLRARQVLPGAAASIEWLADEPSALAVTPAVTPENAPASRAQPLPMVLPAAAQAARDALRGGPSTSASAALTAGATAPFAKPPISLEPRASSVPAASITPLAASAIAPFSVMLVPIATARWALIDLDNQPGLEGAEAHLWQAICAAQGWQAQGASAQFSWPIPGLAAHAAAAQEAMAGWLHGQSADAQQSVVFGEAISAVMATPHVALPSITGLLAEPRRKRELMFQLAALT